MRPYGSPEHLEQRRWRAISLLERGLAPVDVARKLGVDRRSVRRWKAGYRKRGKRALKARPIPGRPIKLDVANRRSLRSLLLRGAHKAGYSTDLWTCPRVGRVIERKFGVRYHVDHIGRLLRGLGFSPQKPEARARERNERAIRRWVAVDWPQLKKKPVS
jgi:transposase